MPVQIIQERSNHPPVRFQPDPFPQPRGPIIKLCTQDMVKPGELGHYLTCAEVQVRAVLVRHNFSVAREHVIVGCPAPGALLAQEEGAVDHFVEPAAVRSTINQCHDDGARQPLLPARHETLVRRAVAVTEVAGVVGHQRLWPGCPLLRLRLGAQSGQGCPGSALPPGVGRGTDGEAITGPGQQDCEGVRLGAVSPG